MKSFISSKRNQLQSVLRFIFPLEVCILIVNMIFNYDNEESRLFYNSMIHYRGRLTKYIIYKNINMNFRPTFKYMYENSSRVQKIKKQQPYSPSKTLPESNPQTLPESWLWAGCCWLLLASIYICREREREILI